MSKFSIYTPDEIKNHPLNDSRSKQQYSFSKDERFKMPKPYCQNPFYNLPDQKMARSSGFGYGTRSDFTKTQSIAPPSSKYDISPLSPFDKQKSRARGKSFGLSREQTKEFGHILQGPISNPGVGSYKQENTRMRIQFSMRPRTSDINNPSFLGGQNTSLHTPGAGTYDIIPGINKDGKFMFSKYSNSRATVINPGTSQRFPNQSRLTPGPGQYQPKNDLDNSGVYVLSRYKGNGTRAFGTDKRKSFVDEFAKNKIAPGVGSYRQPSDFGIYDNLNNTQTSFHKTQSKFTNTRPQTSQNNNSMG